MNGLNASLYRLSFRGGLFRLLCIVMLLVGLAIGAVFPFFVWLVLGLSLEVVLQPLFFLACLLAGIVVGGINYLLARLVLAVPLKNLAELAQRVASGDLRDTDAKGV